MKTLLTTLLACFVSTAVAQTNLYLTIRVNDSDGSSQSGIVILEGWEFEPTGTDYVYRATKVVADEVQADSNTVWIGDVSLKASSGGLKVNKLIVENPAPGGKTKLKKQDLSFEDVGYGVVYTPTNGVQWLHWVDSDGTPQTLDVSPVSVALRAAGVPLGSEQEHEARKALMRQHEAAKKSNRDAALALPVGQVQDRIERIEKHLGWRPLD